MTSTTADTEDEPGEPVLSYAGAALAHMAQKKVFEEDEMDCGFRYVHLRHYFPNEAASDSETHIDAVVTKLPSMDRTLLAVAFDDFASEMDKHHFDGKDGRVDLREVIAMLRHKSAQITGQRK